MRTIVFPIYTLRPFERGIQEQLGRYNRFVMPGLGFQIPFLHITRVRDIREHTIYNIDDWKRAIVQLAMTNLRQEFSDLTLDESLVARETIATNLQRWAAESKSGFGPFRPPRTELKNLCTH